MKAKVSVASGILPIAADTKRLCLAWRSPDVKEGDRYGVIGGMMKNETGIDQADNAVIELHEETGYCGPIKLHPAFIYNRPGFRYHNFIGIVPQEFESCPSEEYAFETSFIQWLSYAEVTSLVEAASYLFHKGLLALLWKSKDMIEQFVL